MLQIWVTTAADALLSLVIFISPLEWRLFGDVHVFLIGFFHLFCIVYVAFYAGWEDSKVAVHLSLEFPFGLRRSRQCFA